MLEEFVKSAGIFQCSKENENAANDRNNIKQHDQRSEVYPEPEQAIDNQIECQQNHSNFFHGVTSKHWTFADQTKAGLSLSLHFLECC